MKIPELIHHNTNGAGKIYFCSDLHYNHFNSIRHGNRPFETTEEMNKKIIEFFDTTLKSKDILFDLGDLFWNMSWKSCLEVLDHIPCKFYKIIGNHDSFKLWYKGQGCKKLKERCEVISDILDIRVESEGRETMVTLSHFPIISWNHKGWGGVHIHGHCHGSLDEVNENGKDLRVDIGWDAKLSREYGSPLIPWNIVEDWFKSKASGYDYIKYIRSNKILL